MPSEYLLVNGEPKASMTANEVKFSDAISSIPRHWRRFSFSMRSKISGSAASRGVLPHTLTGSMVVVVRERKGGFRERVVVVVRVVSRVGVGFNRRIGVLESTVLALQVLIPFINININI
ncbi:hypothetical protein HanPI659440_Chr14g0545971 [Helianthus annuus]|nr:hypothetical protein HanPI659440_Chr14g0545971 [Helianthus annuus]